MARYKVYVKTIDPYKPDLLGQFRSLKKAEEFARGKFQEYENLGAPIASGDIIIVDDLKKEKIY